MVENDFSIIAAVDPSVPNQAIYICQDGQIFDIIPTDMEMFPISVLRACDDFQTSLVFISGPKDMAENLKNDIIDSASILTDRPDLSIEILEEE